MAVFIFVCAAEANEPKRCSLHLEFLGQNFFCPHDYVEGRIGRCLWVTCFGWSSIICDRVDGDLTEPRICKLESHWL